uniref:Uncharacterized protein n=1 Tax=Steinernema glaseri TaxID=37863 RepID=A0A1I7YEX2_9BILA
MDEESHSVLAEDRCEDQIRIVSRLAEEAEIVEAFLDCFLAQPTIPKLMTVVRLHPCTAINRTPRVHLHRCFPQQTGRWWPLLARTVCS